MGISACFFDRIHSCHKEKKPYYFVKLKALFFSFFYEMLMGNYITPADKEENKSLASIKKILDYINLNYSQSLTAAELTALSNYSEYYFMKLFKQYTGKTLIAYINDLRIEKAKPLLCIRLLCHRDRTGSRFQQHQLFHQEVPAGNRECLLISFRRNLS